MNSSAKANKSRTKPHRKKIPADIRLAVLTEAGYRCGVPTCRQILAIDLHHMLEVSEGGENTAENLLAVCPTCHALFHRGEIKRESIYSWKAILVSLSCAFDVAAIDNLLFLSKPETTDLFLSGDGVLGFSRLIAAGLVDFTLRYQNGPMLLYSLRLTQKGNQLISAWKSGNRTSLRNAFGKTRAN